MATRKSPAESVLVDLLYQALQTEQDGIEVYKQAIACAVNDDLRREWGEYLDERATMSRWSPVSSNRSDSTPARRRPDVRWYAA